MSLVEKDLRTVAWVASRRSKGEELRNNAGAGGRLAGGE